MWNSIKNTFMRYRRTSRTKNPEQGNDEVESNDRQRCLKLYVHYFKTVDPVLNEFHILPSVLELMCHKKLFAADIELTGECFPSVSFGRNYKQGWENSTYYSYFSSLFSGKTRRHAVASHADEGMDESARLIETLPSPGNLPIGIDVIRKEIKQSDSLIYIAREEVSSRRPASTYIGQNDIAAPHDSVDRLDDYLPLMRQLRYCIDYLLWGNEETTNSFTFPLYVNSIPWPLSIFLCWRLKRLASVIFPEPETSKIALIRLGGALNRLSTLLGNKRFFGGEEPSEVDALVFSHLAILYSIPISSDCDIFWSLSRYPVFRNYCEVLNERYSIWENKLSFLFSLSPGDAGREAHPWNFRAKKKVSEDEEEVFSLLTSRVFFGVSASCIFLFLWRNTFTGNLLSQGLRELVLKQTKSLYIQDAKILNA